CRRQLSDLSSGNAEPDRYILRCTHTTPIVLESEVYDSPAPEEPNVCSTAGPCSPAPEEPNVCWCGSCRTKLESKNFRRRLPGPITSRPRLSAPSLDAGFASHRRCPAVRASRWFPHTSDLPETAAHTDPVQPVLPLA